MLLQFIAVIFEPIPKIVVDAVKVFCFADKDVVKAYGVSAVLIDEFICVVVEYGVSAVLIEEFICAVVEYEPNVAVVAYKDKLGGLDILL